MNKVSCIGSGNMGFALMKGLIKDTEIFITDIDSEKAANACNQLKAASLKTSVLNSNNEAAEKGDILFLAVKPQILSPVLAEIAHIVIKKHNSGNPLTLVSMAAGWSTEGIQSVIGGKVPVVRIMPNTPALIGKGMIVMTSSPEVPPEKIQELKIILGSAGIVDTIDERLMDAVTGLSGSGPAFVFLFIEALADGGVRAGLPRDKALSYAVQTVIGAAAMVQETGKHPGELKDMVTSPGGTTIAGIAALESGAFRSTVIKAVEAAWKRSEELAR
ncbi:MAG: pyrroline-5-carboxylate reductase [Treponema sp.]|nr:pyrroline-5-carboxylate reductase [Treponema sp.]